MPTYILIRIVKENPTSPLGAGGLEAFFPPLPTFPHSYNPKGGVYPSLYPSPGLNMGGSNRVGRSYLALKSFF